FLGGRRRYDELFLFELGAHLARLRLARDQQLALLYLRADAAGFRLPADYQFLAAALDQASFKRRRSSGSDLRRQGPIFLPFERTNFLLALDNKSEGNSLYPAGREAAAHLVPQQRTDLETNLAVQNPPRLLRFDQFVIDLAGLLERLQNGGLGDL